MNNIINYYYNLYPTASKKYDDYYLFKVSNTFYMLYFVYDENKNLDKIINILNNSKHRYHLIVYNKENKIITEFDKQKYMLLKLREDPSKIISYSEIIQYPILGECNWGSIWSSRIDYYEQQINEVIDNQTIRLSLQYYIGLTEIAISYFNIINTEPSLDENNYSIQHKKMHSPVLAVDYLNPLEMIIDVNVRDMAEYIKSSFFYGKINKVYIEKVFDLHFNDYQANMLMIRLLYPSYFFELYDRYIETKEENTYIFSIMKKSKEYEQFLFAAYALLSSKNQMIKLNNFLIN